MGLDIGHMVPGQYTCHSWKAGLGNSCAPRYMDCGINQGKGKEVVGEEELLRECIAG